MCTVGSTRDLNRRQTQTWNSKTALWFDTSLENVGSRGIKFLLSMVAVLPETIWKQCQKNKTFQQSGIILSRWDDIIVKLVIAFGCIWKGSLDKYTYTCVLKICLFWATYYGVSWCLLIDWWLFPCHFVDQSWLTDDYFLLLRLGVELDLLQLVRGQTDFF